MDRIKNLSLDQKAKLYYMALLQKGMIDRLPDDPKAAYVRDMMGKMEEGETTYETIIREFKEELDFDIQPFHEFRTLSEDGIEFTPMTVRLKGGKAKLLEHDEIKFVDEKQFHNMDLTNLSKEAG